MEHITDINKLKGKTIKAVNNNFSNIIIAFTDNSFCFIEGDYLSPEEGCDLSLSRYYDKKDLVHVGLISHDEFCELMKKEEAEKEKREKSELERLKLKYES